MRDQRPVDSISTEELERIARLRRNAARAEKLHALARRGRLVGESPLLSSPEPISQPAPMRRRWRVLDFLLLLVELGAVAGLLYVLINGVNVLRIYTASQAFRYIVREWRIVEPTEVGVMDST